MADPLDKQLVEAVLSRPRRAKADLEEAKLASMRPPRVAVPIVVEDDEEEEEELDLGVGPLDEVETADEDAELGVEVVTDESG